MEENIVKQDSAGDFIGNAMAHQDLSECITMDIQEPDPMMPEVQDTVGNVTMDSQNTKKSLTMEIQDPSETLAITEQEQTSPMNIVTATQPDSSFCHVLDNLQQEPSQKDTDSITLRTTDNAEVNQEIDSSQDALVKETAIQVKLDFHCMPMRYTGAWNEFSSSPALSNNFTKGCKWSPDGLCVLTSSDDNCLRLFDLPQTFFSKENVDHSNLPEMTPALKIKESDTVYDFCWYPLMKSSDPSSCLFVSTSRLNPIHAWDAYTGQLRASYRAYNNVDEVVAANCVAFDPFGTKLYCGFNKSIRVFDVSVPGRHCTEYYMKAQGQSGIISCIAVNPTNTTQFAAGSYLRTIALYNEPKGIQQMFLEGQIGGVTHLMFSPDGTKLYSGARKDPHILCWDLRFPDKVLYAMRREVTTNQRIYFDIDNTGTYLLSGGTDGVVSIWDLTQPIEETEEELQILNPIMHFQAQEDCVNGVSFNSAYPMFTTSSGQRKFREPVDSETEIDEDMFTDKHITYDNSLCLWWAGYSGNASNINSKNV